MSSNVSDEHAQLHSLIRAFSACTHKVGICMKTQAQLCSAQMSVKCPICNSLALLNIRVICPLCLDLCSSWHPVREMIYDIVAVT